MKFIMVMNVFVFLEVHSGFMMIVIKMKIVILLWNMLVGTMMDRFLKKMLKNILQVLKILKFKKSKSIWLNLFE